MKSIRTLLLFIVLSMIPLFAGKYGEHKQIGDEGFRKFTELILERGAFKDKVALLAFLQNHIKVNFNEAEKIFIFTELSLEPNKIGYGDLTALSADHESDPLKLKDNLQYQFSKLNRTTYLHRLYLKAFELSAPDNDLADIDFKYLSLALSNFSHFHDYGRSFSSQLSDFNYDKFQALMNPENVEEIFESLEESNLLQTYLTLHTFALHLAYLSGTKFRDSTFQSSLLFEYAVLFNGFADHFIQDAFASGHLIINRSFFGSFINNKAMHDFYGAIGVDVFNLRGDSWRSYGDGSMDKREDNWRKSYTDVRTIFHSTNFNYAIEATALSLLDLWDAFEKGKAGEKIFIDELPIAKEELPKFLLTNYKNLSLIPVPYNSNLNEFSFNEEQLEKFTPLNEMLWNRESIRSRIANSVLLVRNFPFLKNTGKFQRDGLRLHFSGAEYFYEDKPDKQWTTDHWFGYTASIMLGHHNYKKLQFVQYRFGASYNFDWWLFSKRYIGIYSFIETGIHRENKISNVFLSPSIGVQLAPLLGLDQLDLPDIIWIPIRIFLLPLKGIVSQDILADRPPVYTFSVEIDLIF